MPALILKTSTVSGDWRIYHKKTNNTHHLQINKQDASVDSDSTWNDTSPTNTVFSLGQSGNTFESGRDFTAYIWTPIAGYSCFEEYTGDGNADGPFINCGFKPRWILIKRKDAATNWTVFDSARNTNNETTKWLEPNNAQVEQTNANVKVDLVSNGFKLRGDDSGINANNGVYVFAAFAETPYKTTRAK